MKKRALKYICVRTMLFAVANALFVSATPTYCTDQPTTAENNEGVNDREGTAARDPSGLHLGVGITAAQARHNVSEGLTLGCSRVNLQPATTPTAWVASDGRHYGLLNDNTAKKTSWACKGTLALTALQVSGNSIAAGLTVAIDLGGRNKTNLDVGPYAKLVASTSPVELHALGLLGYNSSTYGLPYLAAGFLLTRTELKARDHSTEAGRRTLACPEAGVGWMRPLTRRWSVDIKAVHTFGYSVRQNLKTTVGQLEETSSYKHRTGGYRVTATALWRCL